MSARRRRRGYALGACALLLGACGGGAPEQVVSEFPSQEGDYRLRLTLESGGEAGHPHRLRVYLLPRGEETPGEAVAATTVENDGSPFTGDQVRLSWAARRTVLVCVTPRGAARHGLRIELSEPPLVEELPRC